jgi:hypothetical protein
LGSGSYGCYGCYGCYRYKRSPRSFSVLARSPCTKVARKGNRDLALEEGVQATLQALNLDLKLGREPPAIL